MTQTKLLAHFMQGCSLLRTERRRELQSLGEVFFRNIFISENTKSFYQTLYSFWLILIRICT